MPLGIRRLCVRERASGRSSKVGAKLVTRLMTHRDQSPLFFLLTIGSTGGASRKRRANATGGKRQASCSGCFLACEGKAEGRAE